MDQTPDEMLLAGQRLLEILQKPVDTIENKLGMPGFFYSLAKDSDWAVIVKLHALIEALCSHLITDELKKPELLPIISYIPLGESKFGKVNILQALKLITDDEYQYIVGLSELRNKLVHNVANVNFSLKVHVASLDSNQFKAFVNRFNGKNNISVIGAAYDFYGKTKEDPRAAVLAMAYELLISTAHNFQRQSKQQEWVTLMDVICSSSQVTPPNNHPPA
jgi:hypothetical protein